VTPTNRCANNQGQFEKTTGGARAKIERNGNGANNIHAESQMLSPGSEEVRTAKTISEERSLNRKQTGSSGMYKG